MSSKLFAILTVLVIGIVSFLIGKLLTSSKWKKKYLKTENQIKLLTKKKAAIEDTLKEVKEKEEQARKKSKKLLTTNNEKDQTIKRLENKIVKDSKTATNSDKYNEVLNALNIEKKKIIALETELAKRNIASIKRTSTSTFKSFDNDGIGTNKVLHTKPKVD